MDIRSKKRIDYKKLEAFEIPYDENVKTYLGFVRNEYNNRLAEKRYTEGVFLDKNTIKNIDINFKLRKNNKLLSRKNQTALIPRIPITVHVKNNIATLKVNENVIYKFDFKNANLKDGIYTCVHIHSDNKKAWALIDKSKRRPFKKYISKRQFENLKRSKMNRILKDKLKKYKKIKKKPNFDHNMIKLKSEFVLDIVEFMRELKKNYGLYCVQNSTIVELYDKMRTLSRESQDQSESQAEVLRCYNLLMKSIVGEFGHLHLKYPAAFVFFTGLKNLK